MLFVGRPCVFPNLFLLVISLFFGLVSCTFMITNNCPYTIWPGTLAGAGTPQLATTGFQLDSGRSASVVSTPGWSGRIWARTGCQFDAYGIGMCETGDCGGRLQCDGSGAAPPTTLFEITLGQGDDKDFYDVSMVDGYNLPMLAVPRGVHGECNATGCTSNLNLGISCKDNSKWYMHHNIGTGILSHAGINAGCPKELQVVGGDGIKGRVVACKSACEAFALDQYCCSGQFANPTTCRPSYYSTIFKRACPRSYSYAFDDGTSIFSCKASEYAIIFCPRSNRMRNETTIPIPEYNRGSQTLVFSRSPILHAPITVTIYMLILSTYRVHYL